MAEIEIGDAVASGFGLIRREPLAVLLWGLLSLAAAVLALAIVGPTYLSFLSHAMSLRNQVGAPPDPAFMQQMAQLQGAGLLVSVLSGFVRVMIYCAAVRGVLHPEQRRFGYLRIGAAEIFIFALQFAFGFAMVFAVIIPVIFVALIVAALAAAHAVAAAVIVGILAFFGLFGAVIYVLLRFAFVGPMIVADGQFHLFDAWAATKGRALNLFVIGLSLVVIIMVVEWIAVIVIFVLAAGFVGSAAGGFAHLAEAIREQPQLLLSRLAPVLAMVAGVWTFLAGCIMAIVSAPWAKAYKDVAGPDPSAHFA